MHVPHSLLLFCFVIETHGDGAPVLDLHLSRLNVPVKVTQDGVNDCCCEYDRAVTVEITEPHRELIHVRSKVRDKYQETM